MAYVNDVGANRGPGFPSLFIYLSGSHASSLQRISIEVGTIGARLARVLSAPLAPPAHQALPDTQYDPVVFLRGLRVGCGLRTEWHLSPRAPQKYLHTLLASSP